MQASMQIQGPGTTPFDANNQNLVINAFASVMTTVTRADFLVRYFTSDDSKIPSFGTSGRKLLLEVNILLPVASANNRTQDSCLGQLWLICTTYDVKKRELPNND